MYLIIYLLGFASGVLSVVTWALKVNEAKEIEKRKRERGAAGEDNDRAGGMCGPPPPKHPMCKCSAKPILKGDDADGQNSSERGTRS